MAINFIAENDKNYRKKNASFLKKVTIFGIIYLIITALAPLITALPLAFSYLIFVLGCMIITGVTLGTIWFSEKFRSICSKILDFVNNYGENLPKIISIQYDIFKILSFVLLIFPLSYLISNISKYKKSSEEDKKFNKRKLVISIILLVIFIITFIISWVSYYIYYRGTIGS